MSLTITPKMSMRGIGRLGAITMLLTLLWGPVAQAATVEEPVFDAPDNGEMQLSPELTITGSAETGNTLEIAIDGERRGRVPLASSTGTRTQFTFVPVEPLAPGYHAVEAFATDPIGQKYAKQSLWWWFHVKDPLPAPVILKAIERSGGRLTVAGVVKSGHRVRVYVDEKAVVMSDLLIHASGTRSFSLTLPSLTVGAHRIAVTAIREDGKESKHSEPLEVVITGKVAEKPIVRAPEKQTTAKPSQVVQKPSIDGETMPALQPAVMRPEPQQEDTQSIKGKEPSVIILPPATATAKQAAPSPKTGAPIAQASHGRLLALIVLSLLLVALIVWHSRRRDEKGPRGGMPPGEPPANHLPSPSQDALPLSSVSPPPPAPRREDYYEEDIPLPPPPPPPPSPNFASRMDY